ncbi:hypothetical protein BC835DRAFT_1309104 [Cytidiella melzeri]|nr:hypothetical protein BC835DRAFT_1309104 [Cytidiella melzeri]
MVSAHEARQTQVNEFANVSRIIILALLLYDILLNLGREKQLVWDTKFRSSSVLYYVVRYPVLAFQIFTIFESEIKHENFTLRDTQNQLSIVNLPAASFILRVYALLPKGIFHYASVGLLTAIGLLSVALDVVQATEFTCAEAASPICAYLIEKTPPTCLQAILCCQDHQGLRALIVRQKSAKWRTPAIILRSGIVYFVYPSEKGVYSLALDHYLTPLSTILVSRFLLDLRALVHEDIEASSSIGQEIKFASPSTMTRTTPLTVEDTRDDIASHGGLSWKKPGYSFGLYRDFEFELDSYNGGTTGGDPENHASSLSPPSGRTDSPREIDVTTAGNNEQMRT